VLEIVPSGGHNLGTERANGVHIDIAGEENESLTVTATVRANGQKESLYILGKGRMNRVERTQIGNVTTHRTDHSESGWTRPETFARYLHWLSPEVQRSPVHLLTNICPVHTQGQAKALARDLGITLRFIPARITDQYQPLDRQVFGCLKSSARSRFMKMPGSERSGRIDRRQAIEVLIKWRNQLSESVVQEAWLVYETEEDVDRPEG
jgi:hypothetical protein